MGEVRKRERLHETKMSLTATLAKLLPCLSSPNRHLSPQTVTMAKQKTEPDGFTGPFYCTVLVISSLKAQGALALHTKQEFP